MIPVIQKAQNTCTYCRSRKQGCDRSLPSCTRCARKLRTCDYTWTKEPPRLLERDSPEDKVLFGHGTTCGPDLTPQGRDELLQAITACVMLKPGSRSVLVEVVLGILGQADTSIPVVMEEHAPSIHQWCPLIDEAMLQGGRNGGLEGALLHSHVESLSILCVFLLTHHACNHVQHVMMGILYTTLKQAVALIRAAGELSMEVFRAEMLLAVYELGHGLAKQAHITISACIALLALIQLENSDRQQDHRSDEVFASLAAATIMLDRMVPLSATPASLPLASPTRHPLSQSAISRLELERSIPAPSPSPYATSPRKVHIRAMVSIGSGRVHEYIHALQHGLTPEESYDEVDAAVSLVIKKLVDKPQPHTWLHCDAIAMAFCSHLLLQQAQVLHLEAEQTDPNHPDAVKALMALHYSRRMAWDMVRVAIQKVESKEEILRLPLAGLCCVIRAAVAVLETRRFGEEYDWTDEEMRGFLRILDWFAARWTVGVQYVSIVEKCLSS